MELKIKNIIKRLLKPAFNYSTLDLDTTQQQPEVNDNPDYAEEFIGAPGNRSVSDYHGYLSCVNAAVTNYSSFTVFRQHPTYLGIVEGVTFEQGEMYLNILTKENPSFISRIEEFKINDLIGGPITYEYPNIGSISPITLRYMKVASDLLKIFGPNIGDHVCEIGVGYAGQLLISDKVFDIKQYDLFDLPPVLNLASRYLESHILNSAYTLNTLNQHRGDISYDLTISNYAFSELPSNLQRKYIEKILLRSKRGYLTMNSGIVNSEFKGDKLSLEELKTLLPRFEIIPQDYPGNYIIIWGN